MSTRVLVVDDDIDHAESILDVLELRGYQVEVATSGEDGAERFRVADFDLVLMDVKLPGMNGVETFFEFRRIRPEAQVLMMTGFSVEQLVAQAVDNGALGVLHKPFAPADLIAAVEKVKPRGIVLVADDDPDFARSIEPILVQHGYCVRIASTGQQALEMVGSFGVDCLVLDLRMPILSGLEVYRRLDEAGRAVPTILVTGFAEHEDDAITQLQPVAQGLLFKPFSPRDLLAAVAAAVTKRPEAA